MTSEQERWIGRRLGAYEIVALIGSGGMGEVYRARRIDAQYEKEVAIKLVPSGLPASFILKRLRAERQILARLDHPHIAQLIDGGATEEGLPYLVMDLVEGIPLDRYCEAHELPISKRLQLFRDVKENVATLQDILSQMDTLQVQYLLAASERGIGSIHADRASRALRGSVAQLRSWRTAKEWYAKAVPKFESVTARLTLEYPDRQPMDDAIAGLKKSTEALAHLEGSSAP